MGISGIQAGGTLIIAVFFGHISEVYPLTIPSGYFSHIENG